MDSVIKVSVIMIAYKHAKYISKAIDSVLSQKVNFRYEIVIGEDASNDGSAEIIMKYKEKYPDIIVPLINETNLGASKNVYNAQIHCKGKYIASLECDDFWCDRNKLQKQADFLDTHPEFSAVASNYYMVDENGKNPIIMMGKKEVNRSYNMNDFLRKGFMIHGNTIMRRREIVPLFSKEYKRVKLCSSTMGDVFGFALIYDAGDIFVLPEVMTAHRDGNSNNSSFQAKNKTDAMRFTHLYKTITEEMNRYFNGKYDFTIKLSSRLAIVLIGYYQKSLFIDKKDWNKMFFELPLKNKLQVFYFIIKYTIQKATKICRLIKK